MIYVCFYTCLPNLLFACKFPFYTSAFIHTQWTNTLCWVGLSSELLNKRTSQTSVICFHRVVCVTCGFECVLSWWVWSKFALSFLLYFYYYYLYNVSVRFWSVVIRNISMGLIIPFKRHSNKLTSNFLNEWVFKNRILIENEKSILSEMCWFCHK